MAACGLGTGSGCRNGRGRTDGAESGRAEDSDFGIPRRFSCGVVTGRAMDRLSLASIEDTRPVLRGGGQLGRCLSAAGERSVGTGDEADRFWMGDRTSVLVARRDAAALQLVGEGQHGGNLSAVGADARSGDGAV